MFQFTTPLTARIDARDDSCAAGRRCRAGYLEVRRTRSPEDCERVVEMARRDGRGHVSCIVLGRGADETRVVSWLETAASVPGFIGFAVGRTTFWDAVTDYEARRVTRQEAAN